MIQATRSLGWECNCEGNGINKPDNQLVKKKSSKILFTKYIRTIISSFPQATHWRFVMNEKSFPLSTNDTYLLYSTFR